jgi:60 kDa SS-A/Ro ribonucleoprotein
MPFDPPKRTQSAAYEGNRRHLVTLKNRLLFLVVGNLFFGETFFEEKPSRQKELYKLARALCEEDPHYVAALAQYARQVLGVRSGPSALVAHLFRWGPEALGEEAARGVWLEDEYLETLAYTKAQGWNITSGLERAVAERLNAMSPAVLLKCRWERVLSAKGVSRESWLMALPYLRGPSLLINLSSLHRFGLLGEEGVQEVLASKLLSPEEAKWEIHPYQWLQAITVGRKEGWPERVLRLLEAALERSFPPLPLEGETLTLVDVSGSMFAHLSGHSQVTYAFAAASLGALLYRKNGGRLVGFNHHLYPVSLPPSTPIPLIVEDLLAKEGRLAKGGSTTYLRKALEATLPDFSGRRVIVFTNESLNENAYAPLSEWKRGAPNRRAYVVNVAAYPHMAPPEGGVVRVGGWSERLLEFLALLETGNPLAWIQSGEWRTTR